MAAIAACSRSRPGSKRSCHRSWDARDGRLPLQAGAAGARCPRSRTRPRADRAGAQARPRGSAPRARRSHPRDVSVGPRFSQSGRPRRRFRQACRGLRRHAGARLRLRRGGHGDAAAAARQFRPAAVPPCRGRGGDQPVRLQQLRHRAVRRAAGEAPRRKRRRQQGRARHRRRQSRQEPRHRRRRRRLHRLHRGGVGLCGLPRRQHLLAEHAGAAGIAGARPDRGPAHPRTRRAAPEARRRASRRCW